MTAVDDDGDMPGGAVSGEVLCQYALGIAHTACCGSAAAIEGGEVEVHAMAVASFARQAGESTLTMAAGMGKCIARRSPRPVRALAPMH